MIIHDLEAEQILYNEDIRQSNTIELIASENFVSKDVMAAQGSIFTNKYAEGYPSHRHYGGCTNMDTAENLAIERVKELFGCEFANVQPHSGSQANMAVYMALLQPGDTVLSMELDHGGHLSHGAKFSFSGKLYNFIHYPLDPVTEQIDYEKLEQIAMAEKPKLILCGASAYSRTIDFERIGNIARSVGAISMSDIAHIAGLVISGDHPSPFPHIDVVTSTTHKTLRGPRGGIILTNNEEYAKKINKTIFPGIQGGPLMHVILAKAVAFGEALRPEYKEYVHKLVRNCKVFCQAMKVQGWRIVSDGTDNHLFMVDLASRGITGNFAQDRLDEVNMTANKNLIPYDKSTQKDPSGLRLGTAAMTTKGFDGDDFIKVAELITDALLDRRSLDDIRSDVAKLLTTHG